MLYAIHNTHHAVYHPSSSVHALDNPPPTCYPSGTHKILGDARMTAFHTGAAVRTITPNLDTVLALLADVEPQEGPQ